MKYPGPASRVCFADLFAFLATGVFTLLLLEAIPAPAQTQDVTFTGAQTTVPASGLHCPRGVAVDGAGNVLIADSNDSRVIEVPADGGAQFTLGTGLNGPNGVTVDGKGNVFIGDSRNNRVLEVPADGGAQFTVGSGLLYPGGVAVNAAGDVFIADTNNKRVVEVPTGGGTQFTVGSGLEYPLDVALDTAGDLFISDTADSRVVEVPAGGGFQTTVPAIGLSNPSGVAVNAAGDVFIADSKNSRVVEVPAGGGAQTTVCGPAVAACSGLVYPYGVAVDGTGDLFIVDHSGTVGDCPEPGAVARVLELQLVAVNFGRVDINSKSTLTLNYDVGAATTFGAINVTTKDPTKADFTLSSGSTCTGAMHAGSTCVVNVAFAPVALGVRTGEVQLTDSAGKLIVTTSLQGAGLAATTTALTSSANPATYGEPVTFTARVTSAFGTPQDGETVFFLKDETVLGTGVLSDGSASFTTSTLSMGESTMTAAYGGDSNFNGSQSNAVKQVVKQDAN